MSTKVKTTIFLIFLTLPLWSETLFDQGLKEFTAGDYKKAAEIFERALSEGEKHEWVYLNLAASYRNLKEFDKGIEYALKGRELFPENIYLKDELFYGYFQAAWDLFSRDLDQAEKLAREAFRVKKDDGGSYNLMGTVLANQKDPEKILSGVELLIEGFTRYPQDDYIGLNLYDKHDDYIAVLLNRGEYREIISFFSTFYTLFQQNREYYKKHDITLNDLDRNIDGQFKYKTAANPELCEKIIDPLLKQYPHNFYLKHTMAVCLFDKGLKDDSFNLATEAFDDYTARFGSEHREILLDLPLRGRQHIAVGFNSKQGHTHYGLWRYNVDFIMLDEKGGQTVPGGSLDNPKEHVIYDAPVYAPMSGLVEEVDNTNPDDSYVIIKPDGFEDLRLNIVHFKNGSITVSTGSRVETGDYLGKIGRAVHLHIGLFNKEGVFVPFKFKNVVIPQGRRLEIYTPKEGDLLISP